jgi:glucose-1-phosphatase
MKKSLVIFVAILCCSMAVKAQMKRSDDFRARYELKEVVVMSRHNIRSPLSSGGAAYKRVTPHQWFQWSSPSSALSLRGGVLETEMGQFFRQWVVDAGLLPDNYRPEGDEVLFYASSHLQSAGPVSGHTPTWCKHCGKPKEDSEIKAEGPLFTKERALGALLFSPQ